MYNLHLSPEQLEIRDTVRDFVTREIKRLRPDKAAALKAAWTKYRVAMLVEMVAGGVPLDLDHEQFARAALGRALVDVPIAKDHGTTRLTLGGKVGVGMRRALAERDAQGEA